MRIEKSWRSVLEEEIQKPYIAALKAFLQDEASRGAVIYPPEAEVFRAFFFTPFDRVNVVIIGQDPYHGPNQAHGLCFSVREGIKPPPSLVNIYKELQSDLAIPIPQHGCLESWAKQGVLLLNTTLTVRQHQAASHTGKGWEEFTDAVVSKLASRKDPIVFLLWGKHAKSKCEKVLQNPSSPHFVLTAPHPSPFSANYGFFGCRHFSKTNELLSSVGKQPIDWRL